MSKAKRFSILFLYFFSPLTVAISLSAQDIVNEKIPVDPNLKKGKLSNGLTYYIRKNGKPEKKVELRLIVNAGSILEDDDQQGLAHFTEHMAFNGTQNFKKNDLVSFLQSIGVQFGADLNAYTGFDETVYILPIPTDKKENIKQGFQILEDWASAVTFGAEEIDKERGIVLEESRAGKGADDRIFRKEYPKLVEDSKYEERLPIGKDQIIRSFKYEAVKRFYHDWYRPDLIAIVVVGDIDPIEIEKLIKHHFEKLKSPSNPRMRLQSSIPQREKSEGIVVTDAEATNQVVKLHYGFRKIPESNTISYYRDHMLRSLFISMLNQRLQELAQKKDAPFVIASTSIGGYIRSLEAFQSAARISKAGIETAITSLVQENERARKFGFTANELDNARKKIRKVVERAYNERDHTESTDLAMEYVRNFLQNEPIAGIENEHKYFNRFLDEISLDEINRYTAKTIPSGAENKLVVFTGPEKADFRIPSSVELLSMVNLAYDAPVIPYEEKALTSNLMEKIPVPGTFKSEVINKELGTTELTLSNNVRVILKPTNFKNDEIIMNASRFGGQYLYDVKDRFNAEYASEVVRQMGVDGFSRTDLTKVLAGKEVSVVPKIGTISESVYGQCGATDIETMLQLVYLRFTKPRQDRESFLSYISKEQASYQNAAANPEYVFRDSINAILFKNHPWGPKIPKAETFAQLNEQRLFEIYMDRFGDANGFTFVLVGAFDLEKIKPSLATYLGSLPTSSKISTYKDAGVRPVTASLKQEIKKGTEPKSSIRLFWNGEAPYSSIEELKLYALSAVMDIKLIETLREDLGGIYSGGMYGKLDKHPYSNYSIEVRLPCGPENVDKLINATLAEINKIKANGPEKKDLDKVKETWNQHYDKTIKENSFWCRQIMQAVEKGSDLGDILTYKRRVAELTINDIKEAANKYLDMKNYIQIVLNPEKK